MHLWQARNDQNGRLTKDEEVSLASSSACVLLASASGEGKAGMTQPLLLLATHERVSSASAWTLQPTLTAFHAQTSKDLHVVVSSREFCRQSLRQLRGGAGSVLSVAPLIGAEAHTDADHKRWLHVHVRPNARGMLKTVRVRPSLEELCQYGQAIF